MAALVSWDPKNVHTRVHRLLHSDQLVQKQGPALGLVLAVVVHAEGAG